MGKDTLLCCVIWLRWSCSPWSVFQNGLFIMSPHLLFPTNHLPLSSPFVSIYAWNFDNEFKTANPFKKLPPTVCQIIVNLRIDHFSVLLSAGITRFDLLGDFGRFNWLGNFYIVLSYNFLFAVVTTLCLVRKFTSAVREELLKALCNVFCPTISTSYILD